MMMDAKSAMPRATLKTKVCLVGEQSVGKTSLIHRFVSGAFDESYIRTLGAVVTKKVFELESVGNRAIHMDMSILDIMGKQTFLDLFQEAYFHGANGVLAVADVTRKETLDALTVWISKVKEVTGDLPVFLVVNKSDLADHAAYGASEIETAAKALGAEFLTASAKSGANVENAFHRLALLCATRQLRVR